MINLLQSLHTLLLKIPNDYIGAFLGVFSARIFLQLVRNRAIRRYVTDKLWSSLILFIVFARLSSLVLHPGALARPSIYTLLGSTGSGGNAVGVMAVAIYITISLFRAKNHTRAQVSLILTRTTLLVCVVYFTHQALIDLQPFRLEDILRATISIILLVSLHKIPYLSHDHRTWGALAVTWLATSLAVPHVDTIGPIDLSQWVAALLIMICVFIEAIQDFRQPLP